jgi:diguanylate cyclase (GGDEF)-like protein
MRRSSALGGRTRRPDPLLVVLVVLGVLVVPLVLGLTPGGWASAGVPFWVALTALHVVFAYVARRVAGIHRERDVYTRGVRRMWWLGAWAGLALVAGDFVMIFDCLSYPPGRDTIVGSNLQAGFVVVAMSLLLVGLLTFPSGPSAAEDRSRLRLDIATVMGGATTCGMLLIQLPDGDTGWHWLINFTIALLIQPGLFLVALFALVKLFLGDRTPYTRAAAVITGLAAAVQAVAQGVPEALYLTPRGGAWVMAGNVLASGLLAVGAQVQWRQTLPDPRGIARRVRRAYSALPYAAMSVTWAIAVGVLIAQGLTWRSWAVVAGAMVTTALAVARQVTAFRHIEELLRERDRLTAKLTEQAYHDVLTGLANRALFMARLSEALPDRPVTVFLIDLDDFKPVNDSFGHATGDQLLIEVSNRLRLSVRAGDTVARLGGDEFAVLVDDLDPAARVQVADALTGSLTGTVRLGLAEVPLRASIGMATARPGIDDPDTLLHEADMAMYAVKNAGRLLR